VRRFLHEKCENRRFLAKPPLRGRSPYGCDCHKHCDRAVGCTCGHTVSQRSRCARRLRGRGPRHRVPGAWPLGGVPCYVACRLHGAHEACLAGASHACDLHGLHPCLMPMLEGTVVLRTRLPLRPTRAAYNTTCARCVRIGCGRGRAGGAQQLMCTSVPPCLLGPHAVAMHARSAIMARPSVACACARCVRAPMGLCVRARVCACACACARTPIRGAVTRAHLWRWRVCACAARGCVCVCACVCRWLRVRLRGELRHIFTPLAACSDLVTLSRHKIDPVRSKAALRGCFRVTRPPSCQALYASLACVCVCVCVCVRP
jgi:hypothetical protein